MEDLLCLLICGPCPLHFLIHYPLQHYPVIIIFVERHHVIIYLLNTPSSKQKKTFQGGYNPKCSIAFQCKQKKLLKISYCDLQSLKKKGKKTLFYLK